jgi:hypothetical protein
VTTPEVPVFDEGNQLLSGVASQLTTKLVDTPVGQQLAMTVRTASTTLTVFLGGPEAREWAAQITRDSAAMSGAGLVVPGLVVKP